MNRETAELIIKLSKEAKAETWRLREPSETMKKAMGDVRSFIEMPRPGQPYSQEVLAYDYGDDDELRKRHINFIIQTAAHARELAQAWLDYNASAPQFHTQKGRSPEASVRRKLKRLPNENKAAKAMASSPEF